MSQLEGLHCKDEGSVATEGLDGLEVSTPKLDLLVVRASDNHAAFYVCDFTDDVVVGVLNPEHFLACLPLPKIERFILRATHNLIGRGVEKDSHCMLVLAVLTHLGSAGKAPNNRLPIPRASNYVLRVDEVNRRDGTVMRDLEAGVPFPVNTVYLAIATPENSEQLLVPLQTIDA